MTRPVLLAAASILALAAAPAFAQQSGQVPGGAIDAGAASPAGQAVGPASNANDDSARNGDDAPERPQNRRRRQEIHPYIELSQGAEYDLKGGDTVTYTGVGAGIDALVDSRRVSGQVAYRYEHRFAWGGDDGTRDLDLHSGVARIDYRAAPGLTLEAGAIATRTRNDIRGEAPAGFLGYAKNTSQLYSIYGGPTLSRPLGDALLNAQYRIGYSRVDSTSYGSAVAGQVPIDSFNESLNHMAAASLSVRPGVVLPVGLTASGAWEQDRSGSLRQRFQNWFVRDDVLYPVSPNLALTAGVGYQRVTASAVPPLFANGLPVVDGDGRLVPDDTQGRRIAYRTDGIYYDAGVVWRPSRRTSIEGHIGRRYGSLSVTGSGYWSPTPTTGVRVNVYDTVTTFGSQLRQGIAGLPTSFITTRDQFVQVFNGCAFGTTGAAPGGCLDAVLQSVSGGVYRARGVDVSGTRTRGNASYGIGLGYTNRRLLSPDRSDIALYGVEDQSYYLNFTYTNRLTPVSSVNIIAFGDYYDSGLEGASDTISIGAQASYFHSFGRIGAGAALGLYTFRVGDGVDPSLRGTASVYARYTF